jgi:DNA-binding HxlR family transcriptional regulator
MPIRRTYADHGDACAAAHAFDVVGDRWSVVVIRELMLGPKRFNELMAGAWGITPAVLTTRLRELEAAGVLELISVPPPARVTAYQLTPWGRQFEPILRALGRWAQVSPTRPTGGGLTPDGVVIAMRTMAGPPNPKAVMAFDLVLHDSRTRTPTEVAYRLRWGPDGFSAEKLTDALTGGDFVSYDSAVWAELLFKPSTGRTGNGAEGTPPSHFHRVCGLAPAGRQACRQS